MTTTLNPQTIDHGRSPQNGEVTVTQYSRRGILAIWAAAALPMGALSWIVAPAIAAMRGLHTPHAIATCSVTMRPLSVTTAVTVPSVTSMSSTSVLAKTCNAPLAIARYHIRGPNRHVSERPTILEMLALRRAAHVSRSRKVSSAPTPVKTAAPKRTRKAAR